MKKSQENKKSILKTDFTIKLVSLAGILIASISLIIIIATPVWTPLICKGQGCSPWGDTNISGNIFSICFVALAIGALLLILGWLLKLSLPLQHKADHKKTKKPTPKANIFHRIGVWSLFLALITIPSMPLWSKPLCLNSCDLGDIYPFTYIAIALTATLGIIGIAALVTSSAIKSETKKTR